MINNIPNFNTGIALNPSDSKYPYLWDGLVGMWCPSIGKQGDKLFDLSLYHRNGTLNGMDINDWVPGIYGYNLDYDGTNDFANFGNILEINNSSQDLSFVIKLKTSITQSNNAIFMYDENDALSPSIDIYCMFKTNLTIGGLGDAGEWNTGYASSNLQDGIQHTLAIVLKNTNEYVYVDGQLVANRTVPHNHSNYSTSQNLKLADNANVLHYNGEIGDFLVYNRALEASEVIDLHNNRTPLVPQPLYIVSKIPFFGFFPSPLNFTLSIEAPTIIIDTVVSVNPLDINSSILSPTVGDVIIITPDPLDISSSIESPTATVSITILPDPLDISSSIEAPFFPVQGSLIGKIISINPLIAVTDTNPVQIIKIDTTDPENLVYTSATIPNISNSLDVSVNSANDYVYVAGDSGKVVKVEIADLTNQTTFDLSDTDNILTVEHNTNFGITYAGTDNVIGELYTIDERTTFKIDSDFTCLSPLQFKLNSDFNIVAVFKMDSAFTALSETTFKMSSDFKCLTKEIIPLDPISPIDNIIPINLEDYQVFIDSVELEDTDLVLDSISITHSVGQESTASFRLTRKHDQLNTTLEGVSSQITNQNTVVIKIKSIIEFSGTISELDCQYQNNTEFIIASATATEKVNQFNKITMSLPGVSSRLSLYDILIQNPKISNPFVDPDNEENPKKYKGIRVDLGTKIEQSVSKYHFPDSGLVSFGITIPGRIASQITAGTFDPIQNWTYFWSATVVKFTRASVDLNKQDKDIPKIIDTSFGGTNVTTFLYIGTSLAPVSEDLWQLINASHYRQRVFEDIESDLGNYEVGFAPFKDISVRNGRKITRQKLTDEPSTLSFIKEASYNFVDYAKLVADLEYEKLKNINGDILPDTSCTFNLTIDAFLYYDISLLTQMNVDNTTASGIYKNSNGFPVSVKSITISSNDRKVTLNADNTKSIKELEIINSQFPDEDANEYNEEETRLVIYGKSSMRTGLEVE